MVDLEFYELLATGIAAGFFVAMAAVMLARYRRISAKIVTSTDIGKELWDSMESHLAKQDERILDVMTRMEVIQSRAVEAKARSPIATHPFTGAESSQRQELTPQSLVTSMNAPVRSSQRSAQQPSMVSAPVQRVKGPGAGELQAIKLLDAGPKTSVEVQKLTGKSREHAARLMKDLYNQGLVVRDDSHKPFMYALTDEGRRYLSPG
jgi:DNA-binding MarR family transcriptional regulator